MAEFVWRSSLPVLSMPELGSRWALRSNNCRIATVTYCGDYYLRFKAPWMKRGEGGKALDAFHAHYISEKELKP